MRIYGFPEEKGENCYNIVSKFCKEDLKCAVHEIDRTHRIGRTRSDLSPRAIIVKLLSYQAKAKVLKLRQNLKGRNLFVKEILHQLINIYLTWPRKIYTTSLSGQLMVKS